MTNFKEKSTKIASLQRKWGHWEQKRNQQTLFLTMLYIYSRHGHRGCSNFLKERLIMLSYQDAYKIATDVHKGQQDKAGGPYIDFLQNVADYLKNKGESE